jgi:hypothetical protein
MHVASRFIVKDSVGVKRYPSRLGRAGAVRKRKGEIKEVNGHKFAVQQFYQIMRCALCSDLFSGAGAQCEGEDIFPAIDATIRGKDGWIRLYSLNSADLCNPLFF